MTPLINAASSPKTACAVPGLAGTVNLYLWNVQSAGGWVVENLNFMSGVVGILISVAIFCMQRRKIKRELEIANEEHAAKMRAFKRRAAGR